jgi:hypothetical protein
MYRILYVDDESALLEIGKLFLEQRVHDLSEFYDIPVVFREIFFRNEKDE